MSEVRGLAQTCCSFCLMELSPSRARTGEKEMTVARDRSRDGGMCGLEQEHAGAGAGAGQGGFPEEAAVTSDGSVGP